MCAGHDDDPFHGPDDRDPAAATLSSNAAAAQYYTLSSAKLTRL